MVEQPVEKNARDDLAAEDTAPLPKGLVRGKDGPPPLMPGIDELDEEVRTAGGEWEVLDLLEDEERMLAVKQ